MGHWEVNIRHSSLGIRHFVPPLVVGPQSIRHIKPCQPGPPVSASDPNQFTALIGVTVLRSHRRPSHGVSAQSRRAVRCGNAESGEPPRGRWLAARRNGPPARLFAKMKAELLATTFAAWNDFLIDGRQPTDDQIITEIRDNWHEAKQRFTPQRIQKCLDWMRKNDLTPRGLGRRTVVADEKGESPSTKPRTKKRPQSVGNPRKVRIDALDREDVMAVIRDVFESGGPRDRDTAIRDVAPALGYRRVGARVDEALKKHLRTAVLRGILESDQGELSLLCRTIDGYERDRLVDTLLAAMGSTWWEQSEAIRAAARHLGFRRTGKKIQQAFKSAINGAIRRGLLERDGENLRRVAQHGSKRRR